jgi:patatin-like phospholipase/acyl hydrolase
MEKLFDLNRAVLKEKDDGMFTFISENLDSIKNACGNFSSQLVHLKGIVDRYKVKNARMFVDLKDLFTFTSKNKS